ncbi:MAG TPA: extracellular solute-binding protein [Streptosporangiaceae bacterium]|jgi:iron(III) transport system substrate-binding protein
MRTKSLIIAIVLTVAGCGGSVTSGGGGDSGGGERSAANAKVYERLGALTGSQRRSQMIQEAKKEGQVTLYTSLTDDVAGAVTKEFTRQTGVKVNLFRGGSETVLQRILQESDARKTGNDVVETNFLEMATLGQRGLMAKFQGPALANVDKTGQFDNWTATRFNIMLPAWNTKLIKAGDEPRSWEDLASPRFKGKLTMELSDDDWYENVTKYWLSHGKTQAQVDQLWKQIAANAKVAKGHTVMGQLLSAGQTGVDAMNYTYLVQNDIDKGAPVSYRGADGTARTPAFPRPNGVGMMKDAAHPAAAILFYDWLLTDGQQALVKEGLTPSTKVPGDNSLKGITLVPYDVQGLVANEKSWAQKYDALLRGVKQVGGGG